MLSGKINNKVSTHDLECIKNAYEAVALLKALNSSADILPRTNLYKIIARFALANLGAATQSLSYECTTEIYPNLNKLLFAKTKGSINTAWWGNDRFALAHTQHISEMLVDLSVSFEDEIKAANLAFEAFKRVLQENKGALKQGASLNPKLKLVDIDVGFAEQIPSYEISDISSCIEFIRKIAALKVSDTRSILLAVGFEILGNCVEIYKNELSELSAKKEIRFLRNRIAHDGSVIECMKLNFTRYVDMLDDFAGVVPKLTTKSLLSASKTSTSSSSNESLVVAKPLKVANKGKAAINGKQTKSESISSLSSSKKVIRQIWSSEDDYSGCIDKVLADKIQKFKSLFPNEKPEDGLYNRDFFSQTYYNTFVSLRAQDDKFELYQSLMRFLEENFFDLLDLSWRINIFQVISDAQNHTLDSRNQISSTFTMDGVATKSKFSSIIYTNYRYELIGYTSKEVSALRHRLSRLQGENGIGVSVFDAIVLNGFPHIEMRYLPIIKSDSNLHLSQIIQNIQELIQTEDDEVLAILKIYDELDEGDSLKRKMQKRVNDGFLKAIDSNASTKWDEDTPFWIYMISTRFACLDLDITRKCDFQHITRSNDYYVDVNLNFFAAWVNYRLSFIDCPNVDPGMLENEEGKDIPKVFSRIEKKIYPVIKDRAYSLLFCDSGLLGEICEIDSEINKGKSHGLISYLALRLDLLEKTPKESVLNFPIFREVFEKLYLVFSLWNKIVKFENDEIIIDLIQGESSISKLSLLKKELPKIEDRRFNKLAKQYGFSDGITLFQALLFVLPDEVLIDLNPNSALAKLVELEKSSLPSSVQVVLSKASTSNSSTLVSYEVEESEERKYRSRYNYLSTCYKSLGEDGLKVALSIEKFMKEKKLDANEERGSSSSNDKQNQI